MASRSVNKVILVGHLGRDAETKFTPAGVAVTKFSVATNRRWKDQQTGEWKDETDWANVVLWRKENLANYLTKGKQVYVPCDLLNAGANFPGGRDEWEPDTFAEALSLNLGGPMRLTVGCRPLLRASDMTGGACVINMVSLAAFRSIPPPRPS